MLDLSPKVEKRYLILFFFYVKTSHSFLFSPIIYLFGDFKGIMKGLKFHPPPQLPLVPGTAFKQIT